MSSTGRPLVSGRNQNTKAIAARRSAAKQTSTPARLMAFCQTGKTSISAKLASQSTVAAIAAVWPRTAVGTPRPAGSTRCRRRRSRRRR
jgi:hypothetical protein